MPLLGPSAVFGVEPVMPPAPRTLLSSRRRRRVGTVLNSATVLRRLDESRIGMDDRAIMPGDIAGDICTGLPWIIGIRIGERSGNVGGLLPITCFCELAITGVTYLG